MRRVRQAIGCNHYQQQGARRTMPSVRLRERKGGSVRLVLLVGVGLLTIGLVGCGGQSNAAPAEKGPTAAESLQVRTVAVAQQDLAQRIEVTGSLQGQSDVLLPAQGTGVIAERLVAEGTTVQAGELLLRQDSALLGRQLAAAQADLRSAEAQLAKVRNGARSEERQLSAQEVARAEAQYEKARADADRARGLYAAGVISQSELESWLTAERVAQAALQAAQASRQLVDTGARAEDLALAQAQRDSAAARVGLYQTQVAQCQVTAPIDGWLVEYLIDVGEMAHPGTPVARLTALGDLELRLSLPDSQILGLQQGLTVPVHLAATPDAPPVTGTITYLAPAAHGATRLFELRLRVPNVDQQLKAGQVATASLPLAESPNALVIPGAALLSPGSDPHVYVVAQGVARRRSVTPGLMTEGLVEIREGLQAGERVIVEGQLMVRDGAPVRDDTSSSTTPDAASVAE